MKKVLYSILAITILGIMLCGCGDKAETTEKIDYKLDGLYLTDTAYGMEDFDSELEITGNSLRLYIEHYAVAVEEYNGEFTFDGKTLLFTDGDTELEFEYDSKEKSFYNDMMETTWVPEKDFVPAKEKEKQKEKADSEEANSEEPDPIPEKVRGEYVYSDKNMKATITITEGDYKLSAESKGSEPLEITGDAVYAGNMMLMADGENSIECPLDEKKGTLEYDGYLFKKK